MGMDERKRSGEIASTGFRPPATHLTPPGFPAPWVFLAGGCCHSKMTNHFGGPETDGSMPARYIYAM